MHSLRQTNREEVDDVVLLSAEEDTESGSPIRSSKRRQEQIEVEQANISLKKAKKHRGYAGPEVFAHLSYLTDYIKTDLDVLFCGINPGVHSATVGHHFAHKNNLFYKMIYGAGFTDRLVPPSEDSLLPDQYNIGITDLVDRPSSSENNLSSEEMIASVPALLRKLIIFRPRFVCFIGKGMWLKVEKGIKQMLNGDSKTTCVKTDKKSSHSLGLQPYIIIHPESDSSEVRETLFFCSHSSSGLATSMSLSEKVTNLKTLHDLVKQHKSGSLDTTTMQNVTSQNSRYFQS